MLGGEREIPARVPRETGMSEYLGDPDLTSTTATAVTTPDTKRVANSTVTATVHEAYAFACLNCGFGWEQAYEIEHRTDHQGQPLVTYRANGVPVPSPLSRPSCPGCGGAHVRILRAGRVSEAAAYWHAPYPARPTKAAETARPAETPAAPAPPPPPRPPPRPPTMPGPARRPSPYRRRPTRPRPRRPTPGPGAAGGSISRSTSCTVAGTPRPSPEPPGPAPRPPGPKRIRGRRGAAARIRHHGGQFRQHRGECT